MKVLIIGGVAGGATAAARLRRLDESAEIIIIERSGFVSYANCGLPYYIGGTITDRGALTLQTPESFRSRFRIDVRVNEEAEKIDPTAKTVTIRRHTDGTVYTESYDKLILSPGAKAVVPEVPGVHGDRIFTLRTVEDTFRIREFIETSHPKQAVVVGGGFIGLEMAENLIHDGIGVTLLQRSEQVLPPMDYDMACEIHSYLRMNGVDLRVKQAVAGYEPDDNGGIRVLLKEGDPIRVDFVILSVGVIPETHLAEEAGLDLGMKKSILTDEHMKTSDDNIYAVGDAVCVKNFVSGREALISLAGPANKQGRIAADNICGIPSSFSGSQGSSVIKLFGMTAASTGLNEKTSQAAGIAYDKVYTFSASHATYYPGATNMSVKTLFCPETGKILGAQIVGFEGVDKRIDVLATAIRAGMTAADLEELDLAYAPPYSSAKDPVNMAGYVIENVRSGLVKQFHWHDIEEIAKGDDALFLDVRTDEEYRRDGHLPQMTLHIPLDQLRENLDRLDPQKKIYVNCHSGLRSYIACRILSARGFDCYNLAGGFRLYLQISGNSSYDPSPRYPCGIVMD